MTDWQIDIPFASPLSIVPHHLPHFSSLTQQFLSAAALPQEGDSVRGDNKQTQPFAHTKLGVDQPHAMSMRWWIVA